MARTGNTKRKRNPGMFKPGQSGNPGGRPRKTPQERDFEQMCKANAEAALAAVMRIISDPTERAQDRIRAAEFVADRAFGKPVGRDVLVNLDGSDPDRMTDAQLLRIIEGGLGENVSDIKQLEHEGPPASDLKRGE